MPARTAKALGFIFVSLLALLWLVPILMMLVVSLMPPDQRAPRFGGLLIRGVSIQNYVTVFLDAPILQHFINSLAITIPSVALVVLISSLAAFALARLAFFARDLWFYLLIMTLMLPIPTLVVPIFQINKALGLLDSYLGLILPYTALGVPFAIVIFRSFFAGFLRELEEAAILDGCTPFGIYWRIMMPVSGPAVAVVIIWQFMTSWNEFILALVTMNSVETKPLTLVPLVYSGQFMMRPGPMFAILTLITLPVIVVYYLMQRFMVSGLTAGAVRG
ncbi:MAG: carbohydrate ABC transporter permease [Chloroflexi bacterium]|nr:carbohydrate ABC transporter permease [Chloroflexota bacterium]MCY4246468.1 carbohydrate ABC transporter permease [Chloroflexota bacterium]